MPTITSNGTGGGDWSAGATWVGGIAPVDNDTVVIDAGDTVVVDIDMSAYANGIAGLTITGAAVTPGMLTFKWDVGGTYCLKIKAASTISGTDTAVFGRILANSDGVWGNAGALPYGCKAIITLAGTTQATYINAAYLDIALYCTQPIFTSVRVYKALYAVDSVDPATDTITCSAPHGLAANTAVCITSTGALPGGLEEDTIYYVANPAGATLQLSLFGTTNVINLTSAGVGVIRLWDGHTNVATATVNVLDDVTGDPCWTTTDGHDYVVLVHNGPRASYDIQRLQLGAIAAGTITLSAIVNSIQSPAARIYLSSRNVQILCSSNNTTYAWVWYPNTATHGGIFQCEIRGTHATSPGYALKWGVSHVVSGSISWAGLGLYYCTTPNITGFLLACSSGAIGYCTDVAFSGTIAGCSTGVITGTRGIVGGVICGCTNGSSGGTEITFNGTIAGTNVAIMTGTGHDISARIKGAFNIGVAAGGFNCSSVISDVVTGISGAISAHFSGTIMGATTGIYDGKGMLLSGTIVGVVTGISQTWGELRGLSITASSTAINCLGYKIIGYKATLTAPTQVANYKHSAVSWAEFPAGICIQTLGGTSEAIGFWTYGGFCKSVAYDLPTHGTPPAALPLVHEMTFEDNDRVTWVEIPFFATAGETYNITFYGKLTGTAAFTALPSVSICEPSETWQDPAEFLVSSTMIGHTSWQILTLTYTAVATRELRIRVQGKGGDAGGTGTEQLYWYSVLESTAASDWTANEKAQIRQALGLTGTTVATTGAGELDLVRDKTDNLPALPAATGDAMALTAGERAALNVLFGASALTLSQVGKVLLAFAAGKTSGFMAAAPGAPVFRDIDDLADVISGTTDANGNRLTTVITP